MSTPVLNRDQVLAELAQLPDRYRALLRAASPETLRRPTDGTRWTNREMLYHMMFGYLVVRSLLPLVRLMSRLPSWVGRGFAATLNAGTRPFHVVNYLGSVIGGHLLSLSTTAKLLDHSCTRLGRSLNRANAEDLARSMPFPRRWDPFFTDHMTVLDVYHYPLQHFEFHQRQLTL